MWRAPADTRSATSMPCEIGRLLRSFFASWVMMSMCSATSTTLGLPMVSTEHGPPGAVSETGQAFGESVEGAGQGALAHGPTGVRVDHGRGTLAARYRVRQAVSAGLDVLDGPVL